MASLHPRPSLAFVLTALASFVTETARAGSDLPTLFNPHPPALNTSTCSYHDSSSFSRLLSAEAARYAAFDAAVTGPSSNVRGIQARVELHQVGGVSIAVIEDGSVVQHHWYGCRDRKAAELTSEDTQYYAASTSKFIAALGIIKAHSRGDLVMDDDLALLAADFPSSLLAEWVKAKFKGDAAAYPREITLKRLLSHSAGLDTHSVNVWASPPTMRQILMGVLGYNSYFVGGVQPILAPRTEYDYSGGGFVVAEHVLELHTGRPFADYLEDHVLSPAAMMDSTFETASSSLEDLVRGCSRSSCSFDVLKTNVKAAGGLLANVHDFASLLTALVNGGETWLGHDVLTPDEIEMALTPAAHKWSSYQACTTAGASRLAYRTLAGSTYPVGVERCIAGKWRIPLEAGSGWYGLGVHLWDEVLSDGLPKKLSHGGAQTGTRAWFELDRETGAGIVIMINGVEEWTDGNGNVFGADPLMQEIRDAYDAKY